MGTKKLNCWEYYHCGREPGGKNIKTLGVCPAASDLTCRGINSGFAAGRFCWAISGTLCEGKVQGTFAQKRKFCQECDFFKTVLAEEGTLALRTRFLRFLPPHTRHWVLNDLRTAQFKPGERLISQGEFTGEAYFIQRGSCLLTVEKQGEVHPVDHRNEGDILNMTALFTGEPSPCHIEAETTMVVWVLEKSVFEKIPEKDPDLWDFLTEIVADRFDSKRPISDRTIGRYLATDIIGRGGYSIVYRGMDSLSNTPVAIKMLRHNMVKELDFLARFRKEAQIVASLSHENIIKVYDIQERFRTAFIIMEYLEGVSLSQMIQDRGALDPDLVIVLLIQACGALGHALGKGILHRDINPENFMVLGQDHLKLLDFGLACSLHDEDDILDGAFPYLAPEILRGEIADIESEIYSLGTMAFEMVTGKRPYPEENAGRFVKLRKSMEIPDPATLMPVLPPGLARFITKACSLDPGLRYKSMAQAGDALIQGRRKQ